jgi:hypothetical protein
MALFNKILLLSLHNGVLSLLNYQLFQENYVNKNILRAQQAYKGNCPRGDAVVKTGIEVFLFHEKPRDEHSRTLGFHFK